MSAFNTDAYKAEEAEPQLKKRKRVKSLQGAGASKEILRSPIWHEEDGSVVLQAESTQFLVHQSVLSQHSHFFRDMFSLSSRPAESTALNSSEIVDGRLLVHLLESATDVTHLLSSLYDPFSALMNLKLDDSSFSLISALLRLSHRYLMPGLRKAVVRVLRSTYPATFSEWDETWPRLDSERRFQIIQVFNEVALWSFLPFAFYCLLGDKMSQILRSPMSLENKEKTLIGHQLLVKEYQLLVAEVLGDYKPDPTRCKTAATCITAVRTAALEWSLSWSEGGCAHLLSRWKDILWETEAGLRFRSNPAICHPCREGCGSSWQKGREEKWKLLPSVFGLEDWEKLKRKDDSWFDNIDVAAQENNAGMPG